MDDFNLELAYQIQTKPERVRNVTTHAGAIRFQHG